MSRLWVYVSRYRLRLGAGVACLIVATSLAMCVPWLWRRAVNDIAAGAGAAALLRTVALLVGIAVAQGVVRTLSRTLIFNAGRRDIEYDLRNDLFAHLERLPLGFYQTR
jgi:ATP-binding cassette subfamily B protein